MKSNRRRNLRKLCRQLAAVIAVVLLITTVLCAGMWQERKKRVQERGVPQQNVGMLKRVEYANQTYVEKTAITTVLLIGADHTQSAVTYGARQGGQADFLMLLVIDHNDHTIRQLQIDRDTMAEVETLGILGNPIGTKTMQICLSHVFGRTSKENCTYTQNAVERLLEGTEIDYYMALNMDGIGALNDALGGVTVTLQDDFSSIDPAMKKGTTLILNAKQAEILLRSRMTVGDGSNQSRMQRQRLYLDAAALNLKDKLSQNPSFMDQLLDQLSAHLTTNMPQGRLFNEANQAYHYDVMPIEDLAGQHVVGEDGFMEFHIAQGETARWVINAFFNQEN